MTSSFEPIAIIGRACLLPGANDPSALWQTVHDRCDRVSSAPADRWGLAPRDVMGHGPDRTWSDRGGYVRGFEGIFDPKGFAIDEREIAGLDALFRWLLHVGRSAVKDARLTDVRGTGAIIGNLSFPSLSMARFAERIWLGDALADAAEIERVDARNRFMSGLPAHLLARALDLGRPAFCLDAACASSLVAIKWACDRLHRREADAMLAGAVCSADDLFIHVGFCALQAMSKTGQSRPFHRDADGLVPAEGAAMLVLERLEDAERNGRRILGVIRGMGLSNDGRRGGLLAPAEDGQIRAMREAYRSAGIDPGSIGYVECHATGTPVGDDTELRSMARIFDHRPPIGSLKSNLGHCITVAGAAGLIKVLGAIEHRILPPTIHLAGQATTPQLDGGNFRVITEPEPWHCDGPRRAAVSAFGFGGNNAHLIVEEHVGGKRISAAVPESCGTPAPGRKVHRAPIAIVAVHVATPEDGQIALRDVRFPPKDLAQTLPQQLLMMAAAHGALEGIEGVPLGSTGVLIGMGCDPEIARHGARWRMAGWARSWGVHDASWIDEARARGAKELEAAGVVGTMPNIVANRLNGVFDFGGASAAISSEELSGVRALEVACDALRRGDLDAALVGAVDLSDERVHRAALDQLGIAADTKAPKDAAVALVLERVADAERLGHPVIAIVEDDVARGAGVRAIVPSGAHAASGLLAVADAALAEERTVLELRATGGESARIAIVPRRGRHDARTSVGESLERTLRFAAHPPPIALPPIPAVEHAIAAPRGSIASGVMTRAPRLEPVVEATPTETWTPAPVPTPHVSAHGTTQIDPRSALPALAVQTQTSLIQQHRQFLGQQTALHERFLDMRARTRRLWVQSLARAGNLAPKAVRAEVATRQPSAASASTLEQRGLSLDRAGLVTHASGRISEIFGREFAPQDGYLRQVRMPEPPLLLADRMTGVEAVPLSMGLGTMWTETDVREDSWYLHHGRMPAGIMVESGQADLMLISYLGVDMLNRSERVYRLLGCELTFHGPLAKPGETLCYDIHVDGHASQGDVRLFFFHYDCHVGGVRRLSVRSGQAGFFTDEELAGSAGVLWDAETGKHAEPGRVDPAPRLSSHRAFTREQLSAFAAGRAHECFGKGFELAATHTRTPSVASGRMLLLDEVTVFDPRGGPWGRGYLRAIDSIAPDDWFFAGHFKNDPCMPGTLMLEGCLQAMAVFLTALGFTLERDGWRFEPEPEQPYLMRCRGQVLPSSKLLVYEVFVDEIVDGPTPTLYADLLCTVDGLKAFHCRRMALRLVPDWPLDTIVRDRPELLAPAARSGLVAQQGGFAFDYQSLLACAWGRPSRAFGPIYGVFDSHRKVARLPGPPYHFMTRVRSIDGAIGEMRPKQRIEVEYDIPPDAWYFTANGARSMPFCVLLEAALQPCGWLASFVGSALSSPSDLCFRNLDGTGTLRSELSPESGTLTTRVTIETISAVNAMVIESFSVACFVDERPVYDMSTVFGFFPPEAFLDQVGLPVPDAEATALSDASDALVDLTGRPEKYFGSSLRLPEPSLLMIDRVNGIWPHGGGSGLGRYRAEKDVVPGDWFFRAHFFQDPVQPGSLGIEAMIQLLQFAMIDRGMAEGMREPRFVPLALDLPMTWKYRGQVRPENGIITTVVDLTDIGRDETGPFAIARASLWIDGKRIYEATQIGMRIIPSSPASPAGSGNGLSEVGLLDPSVDRWLLDHCPTFTVPALPMMSMVDRMAGAAMAQAPGRAIVAIDRVEVQRWLTLPAATEIRTTVDRVDGDVVHVTVSAWRKARREHLSRFEPVATAIVRLGDHYAAPPPELPPLAGGEAMPSPYDDGHLFHGPAFHKLRSWRLGPTGASAILDASPGAVPLGALNQVLLDAITHAIPHDRLELWSSEIGDDVVAYPHRIEDLRVFGPTPTEGELRCEVRFAGLDSSEQGARFPMFDVQVIADNRVWLALRLVEILMPKGPIGRAPASERRAFLRDRRPVPIGISRLDGASSRLSLAEVRASDWLPGTVAAIYGSDVVSDVAVRDHVARIGSVHPSTVRHDDGGAISAAQPITRHALTIARDGDDWVVQSNGEPRIDLAEVEGFWDRHFAIGRWPMEDLCYGLIEQFVRRVHIADPAAWRSVLGRSALFLANHQTGIESLVFSIIVSALSRVPTMTLAKAEHRTSWLGRFIQHGFAYPGIVDPRVITYFDREDPTSLGAIIADLGREMATGAKSVMVHIEGTRSLTCRTPVQKMTSAFIDMAIATRVPIIPVRFVGGLPVEPLSERTEFPVGMGKQDIYLARPIEPAVFEALPYKERKPIVIDAINALGPPNSDEQPFPPDAAFAELAHARSQRTGASEEDAALFEILAARPAPSAPIRALLDGDTRGRLVVERTPRGAWLAELARRLYGPRGAAVAD
jgi:3-oxoacyl-(acyl-carrier-protein) synthase/3-hydroxymyristoyl/3-hydroxydecanoyl-(acyl carrier protein) dehydratase/1-acyl-sn-glycerol-3-phosphate acyltransferase